MDLRPYRLSPADIEEAKRLLNYQPFIISDSIITGVGYNWLWAENPEDGTLHRREVYERSVVGDETFARAFDANVRLLRTYEWFVAMLCRLFPASSYADISCNTGFFPIAASLNGMGECVGIDPFGYDDAFAFLKRVTGSSATYMDGRYVAGHSAIVQMDRTDRNKADVIQRQFDVVSSLAFLCHVADPLHLLYALGRLSRKAVFVWSGFIESEDYLIRYNPPLATTPVEPTANGLQSLMLQRYVSGTAISTRLLFSTMQMLGFSIALPINYPPDGLPANWHERRMSHYQPFRGFLFVRDAFGEELQARLRAG